MSWKVGVATDFTARFFDDTGELTTGQTVVASFRRQNGATIEFLQADKVSWGTTFVTFALTYVANVGWTMAITPPSSAAGFAVTGVASMTSYAGMPPYTETYDVTSNNVDDVKNVIGSTGDAASPTGNVLQREAAIINNQNATVGAAGTVRVAQSDG